MRAGDKKIKGGNMKCGRGDGGQVRLVGKTRMGEIREVTYAKSGTAGSKGSTRRGVGRSTSPTRTRERSTGSGEAVLALRWRTCKTALDFVIKGACKGFLRCRIVPEA